MTHETLRQHVDALGTDSLAISLGPDGVVTVMIASRQEVQPTLRLLHLISKSEWLRNRGGAPRLAVLLAVCAGEILVPIHLHVTQHSRSEAADTFFRERSLEVQSGWRYRGDEM